MKVAKKDEIVTGGELAVYQVDKNHRVLCIIKNLNKEDNTAEIEFLEPVTVTLKNYRQRGLTFANPVEIARYRCSEKV